MLQFTILTLVSVSSRALTALTTCTGRTKSKHLAAPSILHLFAMHLKNQAQQNVLLRPAKPPLLIQQKLNLQQQHPSSILKMNNAIGVLMVRTLKITIRATDDGWQQRVNHREKHVYRLAVITASAMLQFTIPTLVSVSSRALKALTTCTGRTKSKHLAAPSILHLFVSLLQSTTVQMQPSVVLQPQAVPT